MRAIWISLWIAVLPCYGQDQAAGVSGVVRDNLEVLRGAYVQLRSESASYQAQTDNQGMYRFSGLPPGDYKLKLEMPGFQSLTLKGIHLSADEQKPLPNLEMSVARIGCNFRHRAG